MFASNYKSNPEQTPHMVQFYHMHAKLATTPTGKCRTVGTVQHHSSCSSLPGFTQANEVSCTVRPGVTTPETACKCIHDLPAALARNVPVEFKRVVKRRAAKKKTTSKKKRKARA